ncbi:cytochrome P450 [Phaeosphaeriaceae sp. SRC1lsM3a]|nr:cytochrome P450 [Stagonospora sp. SRC1lsM3a]
MASNLLSALPGAASMVGVGSLLYLCYYVIYQRFFHPLARFPGPFLASLTDLWQVSEMLSLQQPYNLTELHTKYGQFVRYGPDKLSTTAEDAIPIVFQKGGRMFPKTEFYDAYGAYGATAPNIFGMRDEGLHSIRRRHMSHSFSIASVKNMEQYLDANVKILKEKLNGYCEREEVFDFKKLIHFYVIDVLGELAFGKSFGIQESGDESLVPPVVEHSLLAAVTGSWPAMTMAMKRWLPRVPSRALQRLFEGRAAVVRMASTCVQERMAALQDAKGDDNGVPARRKDILTGLILARDPETGEKLTQADLQTEAFGFIIAGTHTTSATTSLLFYHLLQSPDIMARCVAEIDEQLPLLSDGRPAFSFAEVENSVPYLRQCIKENFRITPVFTMPLARRVVAPEGVIIGGENIPRGTSLAVCNHAFHHNPKVWGSDHDQFVPSRWERAETASRARYLMHFGLGGRQCIGKTVALTNIYKLVSTLLKEYDFSLAVSEDGQRQEWEVTNLAKMPELISVSVSDLKYPLMVRATRRLPAVVCI